MQKNLSGLKQTPPKIAWTKMPPPPQKKYQTKFWGLASTQKRLNDNNEEQQCFLKGRVC